MENPDPISPSGPQSSEIHEAHGASDELAHVRFSEAADLLLGDLKFFFMDTEREILRAGNSQKFFGPSWKSAIDRLSNWRRNVPNPIPQDFEFSVSPVSDGSSFATLKNASQVLAILKNPLQRYELAYSLFSIAKSLSERFTKDQSSYDRLKERVSNLQRQIEALEAEFSHMSAAPGGGHGKNNSFKLEAAFDLATTKREEVEIHLANLLEKRNGLESLEADLKAVVGKIESLCTDFDSALPVSIEAFPEIQNALKRAKTIPTECLADRVSEVLQNPRMLKPISGQGQPAIKDDKGNEFSERQKGFLELNRWIQRWSLRLALLFALIGGIRARHRISDVFYRAKADFVLKGMANEEIVLTFDDNPTPERIVEFKSVHENNPLFSSAKIRLLRHLDEKGVSATIRTHSAREIQTSILRTTDFHGLEIVLQKIFPSSTVRLRPDSKNLKSIDRASHQIVVEVGSDFLKALKAMYGDRVRVTFSRRSPWSPAKDSDGKCFDEEFGDEGVEILNLSVEEYCKAGKVLANMIIRDGALPVSMHHIHTEPALDPLCKK